MMWAILEGLRDFGLLVLALLAFYAIMQVILVIREERERWSLERAWEDRRQQQFRDWAETQADTPEDDRASA